MENCNDTIRLSDISVQDRKAQARVADKATVGWRVSVTNSMISILEWVRRYQAAVRDRNALAHLDDLALRDLGMTTSDRDRELAKPIWQHVCPRR
ncbi:DUF1127 domain-containing protein [Thalassospira sp. MA62]|nr:DUF1127 domain-containing protein [Thalassospira sp. MA62]